VCTHKYTCMRTSVKETLAPVGDLALSRGAEIRVLNSYPKDGMINALFHFDPRFLNAPENGAIKGGRRFSSKGYFAQSAWQRRPASRHRTLRSGKQQPCHRAFKPTRFLAETGPSIPSSCRSRTESGSRARTTLRIARRHAHATETEGQRRPVPVIQACGRSLPAGQTSAIGEAQAPVTPRTAETSLGERRQQHNSCLLAVLRHRRPSTAAAKGAAAATRRWPKGSRGKSAPACGSGRELGAESDDCVSSDAAVSPGSRRVAGSASVHSLASAAPRDGTRLGVAAPAESATTRSRQPAHDQVV
jgi:hypothetical protein